MPRSDLEFLSSKDIEPIFWSPERLDQTSGWWGHVPFAFWIVATCRPRLLVELGTQNGVSYAAFCEAVARLRSETRCYAVDTWTGDAQTGFYGEEVYNELKAFHDKRYGSFSALSRQTFDEARDSFEDGTIDLLHIDGYHTYEAVRHDFETWRSKLSERAVVLFHDTNVRKAYFGVWRFFGELKKNVPCFEFFHSCGLGVAVTGPEAPAATKELCGLNDADQISAVRERFSYLGGRWTAASDLAIAKKETTEILAQLQERERQLAESNAELRRRNKQNAEKDAQIARADQIVAEISQRYMHNYRQTTSLPFEKVRHYLPESVKPDEYEAIRNSIFFDAEFYLETNHDVKAGGVDPILHYLQHGGFENRNPGPFFSTAEYLSANPDVAAYNINALAHYELFGRREGRALMKTASLSPTTLVRGNPAGSK